MTGILEFVLFSFIFYWFFRSRAFAMVDVLSTRAHAVYTKWERGSNHNAAIESNLSLNSMKRYGSVNRREMIKAANADSLQQTRDRDLFRTKESQWSGFPSRQSRPLMGVSCRACNPNSKEYIPTYATNSASIQNILKTETETDDSILTRTFCHLVHNYRIKKYDYPQVADSVLTDDRLKKAIQTTARDIANSVPAEEQSEEQYKQIFASQEMRARKILLDMRSTLSDLLLRITSWLLYKLLPRFLTSVCLHPSQLEMLKKAAETNLPLIFVPLHRSHLDYILITFILLNINVKSPLVAAGNNLRIPVFGWLLRGLGAFFIKRRIDPAAGQKDVIYRAVLHTYMMQCLQAGHNIEFYIEGGRTRTGKPCMPKGGLLSVIIDAYMAGTVEDALLVPVSVNYDKLVDGNFIRELLGQPKQLETFSSAMSAIWTTLNSNYGSMRIDFNQPFSLKELVKSFQAMNKLRRQSSSDLELLASKNGYAKEKVFRSIPSTTSLYGTDVVDEDHRVLVDSIARHLVYDCAKACAVMSTNTLAFLLLNKFREGVTVEELAVSFDKLRQQLMFDNRDVGYSGNSIDVISSAVKLLGPGLVKYERKKYGESESETGEIREVITPVTMLPNVIELSYYSNALLPHFMLEGAVATSIATSIQSLNSSFEDDSVKVSRDSILQHALEVCDILQFEFIFAKPCETLEFVVSDVIDRFVAMDIIYTDEKILLEEEKNWKRCAAEFDSEDEDEFIQCKSSPLYMVNSGKEEVDRLQFLHMLFRPLIDTYTVTAMCLHRLVDRQLGEAEFVQEVLAEIKVQLDNGFCSYGECASVEPIKNALKLFKKWGIIEMFSKDTIRLIYLTEYYNNEEGAKDAYSRIAEYKFPCRRRTSEG